MNGCDRGSKIMGSRVRRFYERLRKADRDPLIRSAQFGWREVFISSGGRQGADTGG